MASSVCRRGILPTSFLLLVTLLQGHAQDLIPYRKGSAWGYSDASGKIVIAPVYERTHFFSPDGLARIKQRGLYGYINRQGKLAIIPQFTNAGDFFMGVAEVEKQKRKYCINLEADIDECIPPEDKLFEEDELPPFEIFRDSTGKSGLIRLPSGDTLPERFDNIRILSRYFFPMRNHFALVSKNSKWGALNVQGEQIAPVEFDGIDIMDMKSLKALKEGKWGVLNFHGEAILPFEYDSIAKASDVQTDGETVARREHYIVGKERKYGIVDEKGAIILPLSFDAVRLPEPCNCPLEFIVGKDGLYGVVDGEGKTILPLRYSYVEPFQGSPVTLIKDSRGREGYVSREGKEYFGE